MPDVLSASGSPLAASPHNERDRVSVRVGSTAYERGQTIQKDQERRLLDARGDEATRATLASLEVDASVCHRAATTEESGEGCVAKPEDAPEQFTQNLQLPHHAAPWARFLVAVCLRLRSSSTTVGASGACHSPRVRPESPLSEHAQPHRTAPSALPITCPMEDVPR